MNIQRMKANKLLPLLLIGLLSTGAANAQKVQLTLKDALKHAVENNSRVKTAKLEIAAGKYKTEEIRALALPQVTATGSITDQLIKQRFVLPGEIVGKPGEVVAVESGTTYNANAGVQLNQQLFNQQVFTGLKAARLSEDYYSLSAELSEEQIIEQVATNYYQVLVTREKLSLIDSNIKNAVAIEKTIDNQYRNGLAKKIDLDRTRVGITNLQNQREQIVNGITQQENLLKYYMGMPIGTEIIIPEAEIQNVHAPALLPDTVNYDNRLEYKIQKKQEELLGLQKKAYISEYYPTLSLTGNYNYTGMSNKFDLFRFNGGSGQWFDMASVGLSLRIPIFDGFATRSKVRQANVDLLKAQESLRDTRQSLNLAYDNAKIQIRNSLNTINSQKENVALAQDIYYSTSNNYKNGLASLTDLLDAENALTNAQNSYAEALLNYKVAEIQLVKSNGNIKTLLY
jgi:outer membrane protein